MGEPMNRTLLLLVTIVIAGCASTPKPVAFQPAEKQALKRIAIVESGGDEKFFLYPGQLQGGQVLYAFGAIGGAILGGIEGSRIESATNSFNSAVAPFNPSPKTAFVQQIQGNLQAKGYEVILVSAPPMLPGEKGPDLSKIDEPVDAIMVGALSSGYSKESGGICPLIFAKVRLLSKSDKRILFSQDYVYGFSKRQNSIQLTPDSEFVFDSTESVYANGQLAAKGLNSGAVTLADAVSNEF